MGMEMISHCSFLTYHVTFYFYSVIRELIKQAVLTLRRPVLGKSLPRFPKAGNGNGNEVMGMGGNGYTKVIPAHL